MDGRRRTPALAVKRDRDIQRNAAHPGAELIGGVEMTGRSPYLKNDLLRQVLPVIPVSAVSIDDLKDHALMIPDQGQDPVFFRICLHALQLFVPQGPFPPNETL